MIAIADPGSVSGVKFVAKLRGGETVLADPAPADWATVPYKAESGVLVVNLDLARAAQKAIINKARNAAQDGGAETAHGRFDTTERSRGFILGAIKGAELLDGLGLPSDTKFTRADNVDVILTLPQMIEVGLAVLAHVDAMQQRGRVLKQRIDDAETLAAIEAVVWTLED